MLSFTDRRSANRSEAVSLMQSESLVKVDFQLVIQKLSSTLVPGGSCHSRRSRRLGYERPGTRVLLESPLTPLLLAADATVFSLSRLTCNLGDELFIFFRVSVSVVQSMHRAIETCFLACSESGICRIT